MTSTEIGSTLSSEVDELYSAAIELRFFECRSLKSLAQQTLTVILLLYCASLPAPARSQLELSQEADSAFNAAVEDLERGDLASAFAKLQTTLKTHPSDPRIEELLGQVLDKLGKEDQALPHLRKAVTLSPEQQAFWNNLAVVCLRVSKINEGEKALQRSLDIGPNALAFRLLGMVRFHQFRTQEGLGFFEKSLAIAPDDFRSWYYAGSAHHLLGETDPALYDYREALKRAPNDFYAQLELGRLWQELGMHEQAMGCFRIARTVQPKNAEVHELLSRSYLKTGNLESALESAQQAINLKPQDAAFHYQLGTVLARAGRGGEASAQFHLFNLFSSQEKKAKRGGWRLEDGSGLSLGNH